LSSSGRASAGVAVAAVGLVLAVWGSLTLSRTASRGLDARPAPQIELPERLEGFRADAWFLPDAPLLGFVEIPAGPFTMGSDPGADPLAFDIEWWGDGRVQGTVDLPTYYLARTEVTVAQYAAFLTESGHPLVDPAGVAAPPDHPVTHVSWPDAVAYAAWLDGALRGAPERAPEVAALLADGWTVALPDEAEWEKAARGVDARVYPWGEEPRADRANYRARTTAPVGSFPCPECAYPILDLAGNVWEWTRSPYRPYPFRRGVAGIDMTSEALWVMRGGSFGDPEQMLRAANRGGADPGARRPFIGFRVALIRD
jgi:formylglycine-generating enzyme required for sulfatase activity